LADAQGLGPCGVTPVEVQVLSPAQRFPAIPLRSDSATATILRHLARDLRHLALAFLEARTAASVKPAGSVRLVDKKTRICRRFGPQPLGSRRPTDRELLYYTPRASWNDYLAGPSRWGRAFRLMDTKPGFSSTPDNVATAFSTCSPGIRKPRRVRRSLPTEGLAGRGLLVLSERLSAGP
jgi:hypothetical protein